MKQFQKFITYNNAVPIVFGIVFLGFAAAFAQTVSGHVARTSSSSDAYTYIDTRAIETVDFARHAFNPSVDVIQENETDYTITIGIDDYEVMRGRWRRRFLQ
ncbi:MAG: hypothetical protein QGF69_07845 [Candidatus Marinimicrobia bacterium]|jgi:hypothetical protein|nr:hypothetical protein [Candidatus Neomarinimicrobiota bacterium]|tara:strand:- start:317 stop:622 length:306 start_codon:yes stop_codon:yes gene_type:complete